MLQVIKLKYKFSEITYHVLGYWNWFAEINDSTPLYILQSTLIYMYSKMCRTTITWQNGLRVHSNKHYFYLLNKFFSLHKRVRNTGMVKKTDCKFRLMTDWLTDGLTGGQGKGPIFKRISNISESKLYNRNKLFNPPVYTTNYINLYVQ